MGVTIAITRVACNTGVGNQDITTADLGGLTPKAAWFIVTRAISDGVAAAHAVVGIGAATATDERWAEGNASEDAQGTTDTHNRGMTDECVVILDPTNGSVDGEADFVSFIANGVRINWGNAPAAAYLLTVVLYAGTDLTAKAATFAVDATENNTVDVNTVGFEPDVLLTGWSRGNFDDSTNSDLRLNYGVVTNTSPIVQLFIGVQSANGQATSLVASQINDGYGIGYVKWDGTLTFGGEFGTFDANGFSCTTRLGTGYGGVGYLALRFNGAVSFWAGIIDTPVAGGNQAQVGPGFTPQYVHLGVTQMPAIDTAYTDANAGSIGISVFDADDEYCNSIQDEDGQATSDTQSLSDDTCINLPDDDGTAAHVASFVSFDANGWTWNFSATEDPAVKYWALAIETALVRVPRHPATTFQGPAIV